MERKRVFITDIVRTPLGKPGGGLERFMSSDLAAKAILKLLERTGVEAGRVGQTVIGQMLPSTMPNNLGHYAWLKAELPVEVPGYTVQANADSGLQALRNAYYLAASGEEEIVLAGGADSFSAAPFVMRDVRLHFYPQDRIVIDSLDEAECMTQPEPMSRQEQYELAHGSGETAEEAAFRAEDRRKAESSRGRGAGAVVPFSWTDRKKGEIVISEDEWPGAEAEGPFSPQADGAAVTLVMTEDGLAAGSLPPLAEILGFVAAGCDPKNMEAAGAAAVRKLLAEQGLGTGDVALFEIRENSAADVLETAAALGIGPEKVNPFGGALSFGDAGGAEPFVMLSRLAGALKAGEKGVLCVYSPGGLGMAALIEKC